MSRLDGSVCNAGVDSERPRVAVGEHYDRLLPFVTDPTHYPAGRACGLPLQVDQSASRLLIETVFDESVEHAPGLYRHDEIDILLNQSEFLRLHIVRHPIAGVTHIVSAVDAHPVSAAVTFFESHVADYSSTVVLRSESKVLTQALGYYLQILSKVVALILGVELPVTPAFGDVVHLPEGRSLAGMNHLFDELRDMQ